KVLSWLASNALVQPVPAPSVWSARQADAKRIPTATSLQGVENCIRGRGGALELFLSKLGNIPV
ncbi:MAG TPA: hypothetical protein VGE93_23210, partial [Bryobacteraceae bacterium]